MIALRLPAPIRRLNDRALAALVEHNNEEARQQGALRVADSIRRTGGLNSPTRVWSSEAAALIAQGRAEQAAIDLEIALSAGGER